MYRKFVQSRMTEASVYSTLRRLVFIGRCMDTYLKQYPHELRDLTDPVQNLAVLEVASKLLRRHGVDILQLEAQLCRDAEFVAQVSPVFLEGLKIAASKACLQQCRTPFHVSVVWAMYGETSRMQTKQAHAHGEDALRVKIAQLEWLFDGLSSDCSCSGRAV